jgi:hypothetical protein
MEQHPVPQNIIDVEFKLFGSFSLKQFSKILFGGLGAVVIYAIPFLPTYIKFPLILVSVAVGFLLAIVPNFGIWLNGFLRALFISPRYVWIKETNTPELLREKSMGKTEKNLAVSAAENSSKVDITELPLDKLFVSHRDSEANDPVDDLARDDSIATSTQLRRTYDQLFGLNSTGSGNLAQNQAASTHQIVESLEANTQKQDPLKAYNDQITTLKQELASMVKDANSAVKEQEIIQKINSLYAQMNQAPQRQAAVVAPVQSRIVGNNVVIEQAPITGQSIFGIIVDSTDKPIADAIMNITDLADSSKIYKTISSTDGRFASNKIPKGSYAVRIDAPPHQFFTYKIDIADQNLPAYKFKAKP